MKKLSPNRNSVGSYIPESYLKYIEQTGAMPVIIPFDISDSKLIWFMDNIDMMILPGGGAPTEDLNHNYHDAMEHPSYFQNVTDKVVKLVNTKNKSG